MSDQLPVPGVGVLPVNAFVVHAREPVVVDTGMSLPGLGFLDALGSLVDVQDVRWIWLTIYLLNPGQSLDVGDRWLTGFRPPLDDSPATVGFYDDRSRACFSSDCFGGPLPGADLTDCRDVADISPEDLRAGQLLWATVDSPWVCNVDPAAFLSSLEPIRSMDPSIILSTHLPPAPGRTAQFLDLLAEAPQADPCVGPDQRALEEMLAGFEPPDPDG